MTDTFYAKTIRAARQQLALDATASVLVVCGDNFDRNAWRNAGFTNVMISNLSPGDTECHVDAENIPYDVGSFDVVAVHAGLHHCYSPHRALLEMYRVARKGVIVVESRDSLAMRIAGAFGLVPEYELEALVNGRAFGGVANSAIPNFVYRWTEHEVEKTIRSGDPAHRHIFRYLYGLRLPLERFRFSGKTAIRALFYFLAPAAWLVAQLMPRQGNCFGFIVAKTEHLQPWIKRTDDGTITADTAAMARMGRLLRTR